MKDKENASNVSGPGKETTSDPGFDPSGLATGILEGSIKALAKGITLIESSNPAHRHSANRLIEECLQHERPSLRIGITGVPGVGKSTFIEAFGTLFTTTGKKVAVLAIDPSSSISKGSILGDKTRMPSLATDANAFIRPSAARESLGGVARNTREAIILCEAAGYDIIIVETVGVGQSEVAVHSMVDFFLLLKITGAGDELQGIKRGVMEMADAVVITKADGDNAKRAAVTKSEFQRALHLYPPKVNGWEPKVLTASALKGEGISEVKDMVTAFEAHCRRNGQFKINRARQNVSWMEQTLNNVLREQFQNHKKIQEMLPYYQNQVAQNTLSPFQAAEDLLKLYNQNS